MFDCIYETNRYNEVFTDLPDSFRQSLEQQSRLIVSGLICLGIVRSDWR
ncbi:hypothetical protein H7169_02110 [Candidatus Gracilibacteria bacterium]|nr:hypothetical protein [Candidatus Gracilibacteria bacterium]